MRKGDLEILDKEKGTPKRAANSIYRLKRKERGSPVIWGGNLKKQSRILRHRFRKRRLERSAVSRESKSMILRLFQTGFGGVDGGDEEFLNLDAFLQKTLVVVIPDFEQKLNPILFRNILSRQHRIIRQEQILRKFGF